jgi:glycosyltransferase involved in cell wall biosynthesis
MRLKERSPESKALLVTPTLAFGGAERVVLTLAEALLRRGVRPVLAALSARGDYAAQVPEGIALVDMGRTGRLSFPRLVINMARLLRRERPEVAVGFTGLANFVLLAGAAVAGGGTRVVVTEHIHPTSMYDSEEEPLGAVKKSMIRLLYPRADRIVAVSEGVGLDLVRNFGIPERMIEVVYDPVDLGRLLGTGVSPPPHPWFRTGDPVILSVGRLAPQKDLKTLFEALRLLRRRMPARLIVVGDGPERRSLERRRAELALKGAIDFAGYDPCPWKYMAHADVFALSSRFEGFGLVLVEAMALGLPVVSTDCPAGPAEILEEGRYGLLVPPGDPPALAAALGRVLEDRRLRIGLAAGGRRRARSFEVERIAARYETCILSGGTDSDEAASLAAGSV